MKDKLPILPVLIGPPGVGKSTIAEVINELPSVGVKVLDGDSFISAEGIRRLQENTWDDTDRVKYLLNMAQGATQQIIERNKIMLIDAMTTRWMRHFFANKVQQLANIDLKWVHVTRAFHPDELTALIEERKKAGHPINSITVFERFTRQFEPLDQPFDILENPGSHVPKRVLVARVHSLLERLYEDRTDTKR